MNGKPLYCLLVVCLLSALACVGNNATGGDPTQWDVRGNYALTYDDTLTLKLNIAGAVRERKVNGMDEIVDFGMHEGQPLRLDLKAYCAREEVICPSESLWNQVAIDQRDVNKKFDVHVINVIDNTTRNLPEGKRADVVGGLVDHKQKGKFLLGLGSRSASNKDCGVLEISLASGRFARKNETFERVTIYRDDQNKACDPMNTEGTCKTIEQKRLVWPEGAPVEKIVEGKVAVGWIAACAFGPILAGATLTAETGFTGERLGDFDPPPFTPIANPEVPDQSDMDLNMEGDMSEDMPTDG